ncbi:MAG TPA: nucleoside-diphosphate kinase [Candidatus Saccharimonadales bacterium]|jgi:nucleoside-diphosphate kinase|nr:nucleoside-diphosphate kinase [Candidatus Saccharimonadales bacterium]
MEQTLVIFKPDAVQRGIIGEILARFERAGLKIVGMKMLIPSKETLAKHYPDSQIKSLGQKTKNDWDAYGIKTEETTEEIGRMIIDSLRDFMCSSPVLAVVFEGGHVVEIVRKLVGSTGPKDSPPGTIRGDYAHLSLGQASLARKGAINLLHASGTPEEAKYEISLWFKPDELYSYKLVHEHFTHV